jgi:hypothetical protein
MKRMAFSIFLNARKERLLMSDDDLKIFIEDFADFLNGLEASIVKMRRQIEKLYGESKPKPLISEALTFSEALKWVDEKGSKLGDYQVAYKNQNMPDRWLHAWNVLKANNSVIGNPFHEEGYEYCYWIYPEKYTDRIFRKKLNEAKG